MYVEVLVEERSAESALDLLLPRIIPEATFRIHAHQGKRDLLRKLPSRLRGYTHWHVKDLLVVVLLDEDRSDCQALKNQLEEIATQARLTTKSATRGRRFQVLNRIAVEELEAWYFGDCTAVRAAYPRVSRTLENDQRYRNPDAVRGGTWEAFERVLQKAGYHKGGLAKVAAARDVATHMEAGRNTSQSFIAFREGLRALCYQD